ncbi:MAG TPA: DUF6249 domain-containing protein [Vicinamibacterales bacterium]|nr:DUF6249 domain-containing protein [Vicinamibacterales bacterium]
MFVIALFTLLTVAGLAVMWMGLQSRRQQLEMQHRERLAMIERGLLPPPELDPEAFERQLGKGPARETTSSSRWRGAGIMMIGLGLALIFLLSFAAREPYIGLGVGGAFVLLGAAFVVNAMMLTRSPIAQPVPPRPPRPESGEPPRPVS